MMSMVVGALVAAGAYLLVLRRRLNSRISGLEAENSTLRHSSELLRDVLRRQQAILDNLPDMVWLKDIEDHYLIVNKAFGQACGFTPGELTGKTTADIWPADLADKYRRDDANLMASGIRKRMEEHLEYCTGERKWVETIKMPVLDENGRVIGTCGIARDIDERKRMQKIMIQTEKMVTVGGLAAGMAHELNNPLGAILQHVQNIQRRISDSLPANRTVADEIGADFNLIRRYLDRRGIHDMLAYIAEAGSHAADIITNMLAFSRKGGATLEATHLARLMDHAVELAACDYDIRKRCDFRTIHIIREYDESLPPVVINRPEIERALLNIVKNAAQALAERHEAVPPLITLRTRRDKAYACIQVVDNGPGMTAEIAGRSLEPFFTTREAGVGSGMGLTVAYALVVDNHRGMISVDSEPGKGATVTIRLPLDAESASAANA